jgi:hypothetical protein
MNLAEVLVLFGGMMMVIAVILTALVTNNNFRVALELNHVELWKRLGSPGFTRRRMFERHADYWFYLMKGRYREAGDPALTRLGNRARWAFGALVLVWGTLMAAYCRAVFQ